MRYAAGHKEQTRAKILEAAGRVFRREGYHAAGVDKVMEEAGLTAGGFYAHFASKEALFTEVLESTAVDLGSAPDSDSRAMTGRPALEAFIERYLNSKHLRNVEGGCPLPALAAEVARADGPVKASFEAITVGLADRLKGQVNEAVSEDRILAILALCVGGLGVARAVQDQALGERILASCRDLAKASLTSDPAATFQIPNNSSLRVDEA